MGDVVRVELLSFFRARKESFPRYGVVEQHGVMVTIYGTFGSEGTEWNRAAQVSKRRS